MCAAADNHRAPNGGAPESRPIKRFVEGGVPDAPP